MRIFCNDLTFEMSYCTEASLKKLSNFDLKVSHQESSSCVLITKRHWSTIEQLGTSNSCCSISDALQVLCCNDIQMKFYIIVVFFLPNCHGSNIKKNIILCESFHTCAMKFLSLLFSRGCEIISFRVS